MQKLGRGLRVSATLASVLPPETRSEGLSPERQVPDQPSALHPQSTSFIIQVPTSTMGPKLAIEETRGGVGKASVGPCSSLFPSWASVPPL